MLITINSNAQVIIKEKVEINPHQAITPDYAAPQYTPCGPLITSYDYYNPWQVVWNNISFAPDPYQQMYNFQENRLGPGLQRRVYTLDQNKYYNISIQQPEEYAYFTYGGFFDDVTGIYVPVQYVGTTISGVIGSDIGVTAWFNYVQDYPNGLYRNDSKYKMRIKRDVPSGTEIIMTVFDGQETINYHTRVEVPGFIIESITDEDTLLHYYSREIQFRLNFQENCQLDGYGGGYPSGIKFRVEIVQGQEYGNLYYPGTVAEPEQSGAIITNLEDEYGIGISNYSIKYKADGVQPDSLNPGIVTIRCSSNDLDIAPVEVSFPVKYNEDPPEEGGYIVVGLDKDNYEPGDTAIVNNRWLTGYGEEIDFSVYQLFDVQITAGAEYGVLYDPYSGDISSSLWNVLNGFRVITSASISEDSVAIIIKVKTKIGGGISARVISNRDDEAGIGRKEKDREPENTESIIIGEEELEGYGKVIIKKDECDQWACESGFNIYTGNIVIQEVRENYNNINYCSFSLAKVWPPVAGIFKPLFDEEYPNSISKKIKDQLLVNYNLEVCYDENNGYWKYRIPENVILFRAILDVCEDNILSGTAQYIIHNLEELSIIPDEEVCLALENFENQRTYRGGGKYYLIAPVWAHEKVHKANFKELINEVLNTKKKHSGIEYRYKDLLANVFQPECNETTNSENKTRFQIRKYLNDILSSFIVKLKEKYKRAKSNEDNEVKTQNHLDVQWKISEYKKELQKNRSKEFWESCPYKEKDI